MGKIEKMSVSCIAGIWVNVLCQLFSGLGYALEVGGWAI